VGVFNVLERKVLLVALPTTILNTPPPAFSKATTHCLLRAGWDNSLVASPRKIDC
jgi:hypothetical protein